MPSTLTYAASGGSDTAASGAGPTTAITGSSATNGAGNVVNLNGSPDLSGVAVNDVIWVNSATTNRHLSRITAVDDGADTVTTEDLLVLTGESWAIGGERQTLENDTGNRDWLDYKSGWTIQFDAGVYNITAELIPGEMGDDTDGFLTLKQLSGAATVPEIAHDTTSERAVNLTAATCRVNLIGLNISNATTWSGGSIIRTASGNGIINIINCDVEGKAASGTAPAIIGAAADVVNLLGNYVHGQIGHGAEIPSGSRQTGLIQGNWFDGGDGIGIRIQATGSFTSQDVIRNIVSNFTGDGIEIDNSGDTSMSNVLNNTIYNCTDGISILDPMTNAAVNARNNLLVNNSGYGITAVSGATALHTFEDYNAFYNNTSGEVENITQGANDITLTADPFTDAGSDDFTLNNTAGGGALCKAAAFPTAFLGM